MGSLIAPFKYKHFQARREIRLLKLHPSPVPSSDLYGEILHSQLGFATEPYEALSYTWGDNQQTQVLFVENGKLAITSNLDSAL